MLSARLLLGLALLLVGCGAPAGRPDGAEPTDQRPSAPKTPRLGVDASHEPSGGFIIFSTAGVGWLEHALMIYSGLAVYNEAGDLQLRLATQVPTLADA